MARRAVHHVAPRPQRVLQQRLEEIVHEIVEAPLDLCALENEHGLAPRYEDGVSVEAGLARVKGWASGRQLGHSLLAAGLE